MNKAKIDAIRAVVSVSSLCERAVLVAAFDLQCIDFCCA